MAGSEKTFRLALPSKGRLAEEVLDLLEEAGLKVYKPNPRQYKASIPSIPNLVVLFQRAGDIVVSVRDGSVDFGITGWDMVCEKGGNTREILPLHKELGFGHCSLHVIVPEEKEHIRNVEDLNVWQAHIGRPLRIATKFPEVTRNFLSRYKIKAQLITAEGTLEIAPTIGYADLITDLVSTGTTLRDNRLRMLDDGLMIRSQACLIANRDALTQKNGILETARTLLEFIVAHLRAIENVSLFANMRGKSPASIARKIYESPIIGGLQGPTISPIITNENGNWFAAHIVVRKDQLFQAIKELRDVGGSGVVVTPVKYIFEEEPTAYKELIAALEEKNVKAI